MEQAAERDAADMAWFQAYLAQQQDVQDDDDDDEEEESSSSSEQEESSVEEAAMTRVEDARRFCSELVPGLTLSEYESAALHCPTEQYGAVLHRLVDLFTVARPAPAPAPQGVPPAFKKVFTVISDGSSASGAAGILNYMIENYVNVTYFSNGASAEPCQFNLVALAKHLIPYFVEYSCRTFAKVNWRYLWALSHLIYTSFVIVETGSDNQATSRALMANTVRVLRQECGYPSLRIRGRVCQNIVLKGHYNHPIALQRLVALFHDAVYKQDDFAGVIIKLVDLERWFANRDGAFVAEYCAAYVDEDDDTAFIAEVNGAPSSAGSSSSSCDEEELLAVLRQTDEYEKLVPPPARGQLVRPQNGTFLVFDAGQIICTGCKQERQAHWGFVLIFRLLEWVRCS